MSIFQPKNLTHINHSKFLKISIRADKNESWKKEHIEWYYGELEYFFKRLKERNYIFQKYNLDFFTQIMVYLIWRNALTEEQIDSFKQNGFKEEIELAYKDIEKHSRYW